MSGNINRTRAYLFDYGGTLDTGGQHWGKVIWHAYRQLDIPVDEAAYRDAYVATERALGSQPLIGSNDTFRQTLDVKLRMQLQQLGQTGYHARLLELLYEHAWQHTAVSRSILMTLKEHATLGLVSNFYGNLPVVLREFGLSDCFSCVVESAAVGVRKPDTRIFTIAVEQLGMSPGEVTVVGDSYANDIVPAHAAGCHTVWLRGEPWSAVPASTPAADSVIQELKELL